MALFCVLLVSELCLNRTCVLWGSFVFKCVCVSVGVCACLYGYAMYMCLCMQKIFKIIHIESVIQEYSRRATGNGIIILEGNTLTACQTSGEFGCVPGWGLNDGGAEDSAESLSDPDKSCCRRNQTFQSNHFVQMHMRQRIIVQ